MTNKNPYTPPTDITQKPERVQKLLGARKSQREGVTLIQHVASQYKDEFGSSLEPYFSERENKDQAPLFMYHNPDLKRDVLILDAAKKAGAVLVEDRESHGGTKSFQLLGCNLEHKNIKPVPLTDNQKENIAEAAKILERDSQRIADILLKYHPDKKDVYGIIQTCHSIAALSKAIDHQDLDEFMAIDDKIYSHSLFPYHLKSASGLSDDIHRGLFHPDQNSLTSEEKQAIQDAEKKMRDCYARYEPDLNAGLHHLLYKQAEQAYEKQQAELPKGCVGTLIAPAAIIKNNIMKMRGGKE